MLRNPPPGDWLIFRRNYQGHSYSPLNQITRDNVKNLQLQWVWAMNDSGANQTTPIVHNGVIYLASPSNIVQALDGENGHPDLGNARRSRSGAGLRRHPQHRHRRRQDLSADQRRAHGGAQRAQRRDPVGHAGGAGGSRVNTSGAVVIGDKVLQGMTGCTRFDGLGCYISAYDINTGQQAWKFYTVPREGEPGSETWGKLPMTFRGGADTWIAGSYDPDLNLTYWGVSQAKPWNFLSRKLTLLDKTLYANSTVALNPDTGKLAWYFQHAPAESFDLDEVFERVLVDIGDQKVVVQRGQSRCALEARSADRPVPRPQADGRAERLGPHRSEDRRAELSARHSRDADRQADFHLPEHRGRQELAGDELQPAGGRHHRAAQPVVHGFHRAGSGA